MSTNQEFDAIVADMDMSDNVTCDACQESPATVRVSYACDEPDSLLCGHCMMAYGMHIMDGMSRALVFGGVFAHKCGAPLRCLLDLARHIMPENIDGTEFDPEQFM